MSQSTSRSSSISSLSSVGNEDAATPSSSASSPSSPPDRSEATPPPPSLSPVPSVPSPAPPTISHFARPKAKLVTYSRRPRPLQTGGDSPLSTPDVTPRKATASKERRALTKGRPFKVETPTKNGKARSSAVSVSEPTPKRSRKPAVASASKATPRATDGGELPLSSPAPSDSESESAASRESTPEAMPKRARRPTADARKDPKTTSAPSRAKKRVAPRQSTPSAPSSGMPKAKKARQSLPAKLPARDKPKEEGESFLDGDVAPKPKPKRKRASTNAVAKAKSVYLSTDEEEPVASSSRLTLSAKKTSSKRVPRGGRNDPAAVFEMLQEAAVVNGSFSSLPKTSQTFNDEEDEEEMTLDNVLRPRSASLSPPPGSPTPTLTPGRRSAKKFEPTQLPLGIGAGCTCVVRQNHNYFVAVLQEFHAAQNASESDRFTVLERGSSTARTVRRRDIVFLSEDTIASCSLGQYAITVPERSAKRDTDFVDRVQYILPYLRLVLKDEYGPARWRADMFWVSPATLSNVAEYGDLTEDETAEIAEIITEWIKGETGSERFEALGEKEKQHFIQDVLVPETAVGLVLASLGEESWLVSTANGDGEAIKTDEPTANGADETHDAPEPETKDDDAREDTGNEKSSDPSAAPPTADADSSEMPAANEADQLAVDASEQPTETPNDAQPTAAKNDAPDPTEETTAAGQPTTAEPAESTAPDAAEPARASHEPTGPAVDAEAPIAEPATEEPEPEAEEPPPSAAAGPAPQPEQPAESDTLAANGASEAMDVDPPVGPTADPASEPVTKPDLDSAYAAARARLAELRAAASHKQWAMRQTEVLRARRERRAKLKLPSELETEEDRAEAGVADGTLGRSARGRVRRKVNYKDP